MGWWVVLKAIWSSNRATKVKRASGHITLTMALGMALTKYIDEKDKNAHQTIKDVEQRTISTMEKQDLLANERFALTISNLQDLKIAMKTTQDQIWTLSREIKSSVSAAERKPNQVSQMYPLEADTPESGKLSSN
jgi:hypothetical protein